MEVVTASVLGYLAVGFIWFIYVLAVSYAKNIRLSEGTLLGCTFGWPITIAGYACKVKTGKYNQYDPLPNR